MMKNECQDHPVSLVGQSRPEVAPDLVEQTAPDLVEWIMRMEHVEI